MEKNKDKKKTTKVVKEQDEIKKSDYENESDTKKIIIVALILALLIGGFAYVRSLEHKKKDDGKKTEEQVGPYILHDFFLYHFLRYGAEPKKIYILACKTFKNDFKKEEIKHWLQVFIKRFFIQQFKRNCMPDGPKVGTVSLSPRGDLRMPSDASYNIWLNNLK